MCTLSSQQSCHFIFTAKLYHLTRFPSATTVTIWLLCMLSLYTQSLLLCTVYRPPDSPDSDFSNCLDKLQEMINDHSKDDRHSDVYVIGDFNMPVFNWEESAVSTNPPNGAYQRLMTFLKVNFLTQVVKEPTRGPSILDLILTCQTLPGLPRSARPSGRFAEDRIYFGLNMRQKLTSKSQRES